MKSWRCDIKLKIICITTAEAIRSGKEDIKYEKKDSYVKRLYYGDQHISNCISCWYFYFLFRCTAFDRKKFSGVNFYKCVTPE